MKIKKPTLQVDNNISLSQDNHDKLLQHLKDKLDFAKPTRDTQASKFEIIDKRTYGYLVLDENDDKRERDNQKGYGIKPTDTTLPLAQVQMDDATTFLIDVLGVDNDLYGAIAPKEKQSVANGFSALMNEHASKFGHIVELNKFLFDCLKYNFGVLIPEWEKIHGNKITNGIGIDVKTDYGVVYEGNRLRAPDLYNFFYDISVNPVNLSTDGEFFAEAEVFSKFKIKQKLDNKQIFNCEDLLDKGSFNITYYRPKPAIRSQNSNASTSWLSMLGGENGTSSEHGMELVRFYIWLQPNKFGLGKEKTQSIYRVVMANNQRIVRVQEMTNAHGLLPVGVAMPWDDGFKENTKSYGELLLPLQTFASSQINTHQRANRKALYGITFFNKNVVSLGDDYDPIASKVGVNASPDVDIRKAIHQVYDGPNTENTLRDIEAVAQIMQQILPTDILKQVAGLERATQYQAASTVQGANRRNLKIAKIINSQGFAVVKHIQMYNILQYQPAIEILNEQGELMEIKPNDFRDTKLEFTVSEGLKGLDKLSMIINIKEVLNSILQSQQASQQMDVVSIINYWTSLLGDKTDFSQFKFESAIDALPPEQKDIAFQLLQAAMQEQTSAQPQPAGASQQ